MELCLNMPALLVALLLFTIGFIFLLILWNWNWS